MWEAAAAKLTVLVALVGVSHGTQCTLLLPALVILALGPDVCPEGTKSERLGV